VLTNFIFLDSWETGPGSTDRDCSEVRIRGAVTVLSCIPSMSTVECLTARKKGCERRPQAGAGISAPLWTL